MGIQGKRLGLWGDVSRNTSMCPRNEGRKEEGKLIKMIIFLSRDRKAFFRTVVSTLMIATY